MTFLLKKIFSAEPYRGLFILGILLGCGGIVFWPFFYFQYLPYPRDWHINLMTGGFIMTIASGFLMTAIPRFTGSASATAAEKAIVLFLAIFYGISVFTSSAFVALFGMAQSLFLICFGLMRISKGSFRPPPSFAFVGLGILLFFFGNLLYGAGQMDLLHGSWLTLGSLFRIYGFTYGIVLGVGSKLLPMLMGTAKQMPGGASMPTPLSMPGVGAYPIRQFIIAGLILVATFFMEAWGLILIGRLIRTLLSTLILLGVWRIHKRPEGNGMLAWALWISSWMFLLGGWVGVLFPWYGVHGNHILFIGSVSLMVFAVASRVTLSHGGHEKHFEKNIFYLGSMTFLFSISLIIRLLSPFLSNPFLGYSFSAILWMAAVIFWSIFFVPKLLFTKQ